MSNQGQQGRFVAVKDFPLNQQAGDQAETLRAYVAQNPEVKQTPTEPDYQALWLGLKARLGRIAEGHCLTLSSLRGADGVKVSEVIWEQSGQESFAAEELAHMEQAETLARFKAQP